MRGTTAAEEQQIQELQCVTRGQWLVTHRPASICGRGKSERAVAGFVRLDPFVLRHRGHRRLVRQESTAGWKGCIRYQDRARRDTTAQAQTEGLAVAWQDQMGAMRGGGRAHRDSFVRRERRNLNRVLVAPFLERRGTSMFHIARRARRGTIVPSRT